MYEIIFNPGSRSNRSTIVWDTVKDYLLKNDIPYSLHKTTGPKDAEKIAQEITSDKSPHTILVIGGDGTLNEVVNGLCYPDLVTMGLIPSGSGNDFAKALGISTSPSAAIAQIVNCKQTTPINFGKVSTETLNKRFLISCGCGFDSDVCVDVQVSRLKPILNKLKLGKLIYTIIALKKLIKKSTFSAKMIFDSSEETTLDEIFFLTAMNTTYEGGGYMFCPNASPSDDQLDFLTVDHMPRRRMIPLLPKAQKGKHVGHKGISIQNMHSVGMEFSRPVNLHTDGEVCGAFCRVEIKCAEEHIHFFLPDKK